MTSITTRVDLFHQRKYTVATYEACSFHQATSLLSTSEISSNVIVKTHAFMSFPSPKGRDFKVNKASFSGTRGRDYGRGSQHFSLNDPIPICQVCNKPNNITLVRYRWFNQAFQPPTLPTFTSHYITLLSSTESSPWLLDSTASHHFTSNFLTFTLSPLHGS